jgi:hypothetical protein
MIKRKGHKPALIKEILKNPVYMPDSRGYLMVATKLMEWSISHLEMLAMILRQRDRERK